MPEALVTGATGFVGGAVLRELLRRGWHVRVLVRPTSDPRNLEAATGPCETFQGDLRDRESLRAALKGCDTLFHVAARYSLWNPDPSEIYRDNVDGTRNILEAAGELGVSRIVYTSTVGVLKIPRDGAPADESSVAEVREIRGHYKRSKWYAEQCALGFASKGLPVVIVNPTAPVGPWDVKPTPTGRMIVDFLDGRMLAYTDTGLNLVSVDDVAVGNILAAEKGVPGRRYILGCENLSLKDVLGMLADLTGIPAPRLFVPRKLLLPLSLLSEAFSRLSGTAPRISLEAAHLAQKRMYFDTTRARRELGFSPGAVREALRGAIDWFRENGYVRPSRRVRRGPSDPGRTEAP